MSVIKQWQGGSILDLQEQPEDTLHEHLVSMPGEQWCLWRCVGLRGAGFPVTGVLKLAASECARIADDFIRAEDKAEQTWETALNALSSEIDEAEPGKLDGLVRAMRQLKNGQPPQPLEDCEARQHIERFVAACAKAEDISQEFYRSFESAMENISESIKEVVRHGAFREAITWQNRNALHTGMDALLESAASRRSSRQRKREELVASYWQRYCTKNDTIGFFGPVGWARFVSQEEPLSVKPGPSLLADRKLYFEVWCMDALAEMLVRDEAIRPWIAPRRMPFIYVDDQSFYAPKEIHCSPTVEDLAILRLCDGERTAKEIAQELIARAALALNSAHAVYEKLARLRDDGIISWSLQVPSSARTEISLRRKLERIRDEPLRGKALEALNELERARAAVAGAAGDAQRLDEAMSELEATFTRLTGSASTRNEGKTYAGRTLVYEDCRRDIEVEIGPRVIKELGPALSLLLLSARWVTYTVGEQYRSAFAELYRQMVYESGSPVISAIDFWARIQSTEFSDEGPLVEPCLSTLRQRWSEILSITPGQRRVSYSSEQLRRRVIEAFDAPRPGWQEARYHSPDLMIAAPSVDDIRQGNYQIVLGELHVARNTLSYSVFLEQHPRVEELFKAVDLDLPRPRLLPVPPRYMTGCTSRICVELISPKDYRLEFSRDAPASEDSQSLAIGELVVEEKGGGLIVRTREGRLQLDIIDAFGDALTAQVVNSFRVLTPGNHAPRISIDRLVVGRETWRFSTSEMEFAFEEDEACRFLEARRWATLHRVPRFIFIKTLVEVKPLFVDLDSPVLVNLFARMVRQASEKSSPEALVTVTEMLPRPDQAWLPDAEGNRYTSELRMVAVDLKV